MKFGNDVLVTIVAIVRRGIMNGEDISQLLREVKLKQSDDGSTVNLSDDYVFTENTGE